MMLVVCLCRELSIKLVFNVNIFAEFLATLAQAFLLLNIYPDLLYFVYPLALYKRSFHTLFRKVFFCLLVL
jgi:hypothetical protein